MSPPPSLPPDSVYTSCYCEENIYLLCRALLQTPSVTELWDIFVVFISNANKAVALWYQKTARSPDYPVVWDYHVILVLRPRRKEHTKETGHPEMHSWVYDFDTTLGLPHPWEDYFSMTFPEDTLPEYASLFRVVGGDLYVQNFASDRSHMLKGVEAALNAPGVQPSIYSSPPPKYEVICGPSAAQRGITNNLMLRYVSMSTAADLDRDAAELYGVVLEREGVDDLFA